MEESIAVIEFNRERNRRFIGALFSAVDPKQANDLLKDYRGIIFPEEKFDDVSYLKKVKGILKNLGNVDMRMKPTDI